LHINETTANTSAAIFTISNTLVNQGIITQNTDLTANSVTAYAFQFYDDGGTTRIGGAIVAGKEQLWTSTVATRDSYIALSPALNGTTTERMRITSAGNVGIGTTGPGYTLTVAGTAWVTSGAWSGSDARWKQDIQPITGALDKVLQLSGVSYNWRKDEFPENKFDDKTHLGLIAQDLENIIPELVTTGPDGYKGIDYNGLAPLLIGAIQEQQGQIASLKNQIASFANNTIARFVKVETNLISPLPGGSIFIDGPVEISGDTTISGTLTASKIESSTIDNLREKIEALANSVASEESVPATPEVSIDVNTLNAIYELLAANDATDSAEYADLAFINAEGAFFSEYLAVLGTATITDLQVTNSLTLAKITGYNGTIDLAGNLNISGGLTVTGNVEILGELTAPTASFGALLAQRLEAEEIKVGQLIIAASSTSEVKEVSTSEVSTPSANITTNATAGKAIIPNGSTELTINSPHVDASSLIYVTPTGDPQNQVLFVKSKQTCPNLTSEVKEVPTSEVCTRWFKVAINQALPYDLEFNWWIIKLE